MAETWDETKPAGSRNPIFGDDDFREHKRAERERLAEDHEFTSIESPAFGEAGSKIGKHRYVTLLETSGDKTTLENEICILAKDVSGQPEIYIVPESGGTGVQITRNGGNLNVSSIFDDDLWTGIQINADTSGTLSSITGQVDSQSVFALDSSSIFLYKNVKINIGATGKLAMQSGTIKTDTIDEYTSGSGVTIDDLQIKDGEITTPASVDQLAIAPNSVGQSELKGATTIISQASVGGGHQTVSGVGIYGFWPQIRGSSIGTVVTCYPANQDEPGTDYLTRCYLYAGLTGTAYARFAYVDSSGEIYWMFFLLNKSGKILATNFSPDHPCFGNTGDPTILEHPFCDYDSKKHNIVAHTMDLDTLRAFVNNDPEIDITELVLNRYKLDFSVEPAWPTIPVTVKNLNSVFYLGEQKKKMIVKSKIPQPKYIRTVGLKKK